MGSTSSDSPRTLLSLPPEIRDMIWAYVVKSEKPVHLDNTYPPRNRQVGNKTSPIDSFDMASFDAFLNSLTSTTNAGSHGRSAPVNSNAISMVNHQVHNEALAVFCAINTFLVTKCYSNAIVSIQRFCYWVPKLKLGPLICWIDDPSATMDWAYFLEVLHMENANAKVKLFFPTPQDRRSMKKWKHEYCSVSIQKQLASDDDPSTTTVT